MQGDQRKSHAPAAPVDSMQKEPRRCAVSCQRMIAESAPTPAGPRRAISGRVPQIDATCPSRRLAVDLASKLKRSAEAWRDVELVRLAHSSDRRLDRSCSEVAS